MDTIRKTQIIINSTILFVVASTLEMTLHEFGHFFAAIMVHAKGISIHHNYVSNVDDGISLQSLLFIKGAGPFISLLIGILFQWICSHQTKRNMLFLFNLYMSAFGYIGFFGYLMIAPMFTGGDTGPQIVTVTGSGTAKPAKTVAVFGCQGPGSVSGGGTADLLAAAVALALLALGTRRARA